MFQSSCKPSVARIIQRHVSQLSANIIMTKVCDPECRKKNIPLKMLQKPTCNDYDFKSAILLVMKDVLKFTDRCNSSISKFGNKCR